VAGDVIAQAEELVGHGYDPVEIAIAEHPLALRRRDPAHRLVRDRGLQRPRGVEQPAVVIRLLVLARTKARLREDVGQIGANGRAFGHDMTAMLDCRDFAHRVDREVCFVLPTVIFVAFGVVQNADLLQHPADDPSTRLRVGVEDQVGHFRVSRFISMRADYACSSACSSISSMALSDSTRIAPRPFAPKCSSRCSVPPPRRARAMWTRPSSWSGPAGPAKPVTPIARSAFERASAPSALARATTADTASFFSSRSRSMPRSSAFASLV